MVETLKVSVLEKVQAHLLTWLLPTIGTVALGIVLLLEQHLAKLIPQPTETWAVRAIAISLLLLGLLTASYFRYRPKFKHLPRLGVHQNIKTGAYFCSPCLIKNKLHSPLRELPDGSRWHCRVCGVSVNNPDYKEPPKPPKPNLDPRTAWMAR